MCSKYFLRLTSYISLDALLLHLEEAFPMTLQDCYLNLVNHVFAGRQKRKQEQWIRRQYLQAAGTQLLTK